MANILLGPLTADGETSGRNASRPAATSFCPALCPIRPMPRRALMRHKDLFSEHHEILRELGHAHNAARSCCRTRAPPIKSHPMFEAKFQTFDDRNERGEVARPRRGVARRIQEARPRRLRRAARRPASERICAAERRAAGLAHRLHRLGRRGDRARRPRRAVRRRPLHRAGARRRPTPRCSTSSTWSKRRPSNGSTAICKAGAKLGYDPWLHTAEQAEKLDEGLRGRGRDACSRSIATRSTRCGATAPRRPPARSCCMTSSSAGEQRADKLRRIRAEIDEVARSMRCWCPIRKPWPGPSTSAAATSPIRRCRSAVASAARGPAGALFRRPQARQCRARTRWKNSPMCASRRRSKATSPRSRARPCGSTAPARRDALSRLIERAGGKVSRGADPIALHEGGEERSRNRRRPRGASARRRGDGALPRLVRPGSAGRQAHRDRRRRRRWRPSAATPARSRTSRSRPSPAPGPNGAIVHYRVTRNDQPHDRRRRAVPDRFRRAI